MVPFRKGADGVVARESRFATRFDTLRVSDHPVCGASVASRLFIDAAATPPCEGGECARIETLHRPPLQFSQKPQQLCRYGLFGLALDGHIPVLRLREALFEIARGRSGVRWITPGNNQSRNVQLKQIFRFSSRRRVPVK